MPKLLIVTTHPIQYNAPLFKQLSQNSKVELMVYYTWSQSNTQTKFDPEFGISFAWDIPLLDGYDYKFIDNVAKEPGSHHFRGIKNPTLVKEVIAYKPDAILVYGWNFYAHLKLMRRFKHKIPIYFRGDSTLIDGTTKTSIKSLLRATALKWVYSNINFAFNVGQANKAYFKAMGLKESQLIFAPHSIENDRFEQAEITFDLRSVLSIPNDRKIFLFAGKFIDKKNPLLLLEAYLKLEDKACDLVLVGNGHLEAEMKAMAKGNDHVHFLPFQNQTTIPSVYKTCDIFVLPSKEKETWGLAINEAMACGKAVIASNKCGCAQDLIQNGNNGHIFESQHVNDLRDKMADALVHSKEMGQASTQIIKKWSIQQTASAIEKTVLSQ